MLCPVSYAITFSLNRLLSTVARATVVRYPLHRRVPFIFCVIIRFRITGTCVYITEIDGDVPLRIITTPCFSFFFFFFYTLIKKLMSLPGSDIILFILFYAFTGVSLVVRMTDGQTDS